MCPVSSTCPTSFVAVCSHVFSQPGNIVASSQPPTSDDDSASKRCEYYIRAPPDSRITLNFTKLYGFTLKKHHRSPASDRSANVATDCLPRVEIVEVTHSNSEQTMCTLCELHNNSLAPQVFLSRTPVVRLVFTWVGRRRSFFHLTFDFNHLESKSARCVLHTRCVTAIASCLLAICAVLRTAMRNRCNGL